MSPETVFCLKLKDITIIRQSLETGPVNVVGGISYTSDVMVTLQ